MAALAENGSVQRHKRLRRGEREQRVRVGLRNLSERALSLVRRSEATYRTEEEENDGGQPTKPTDNRTPENSPSGRNGSVFRLFSHMARGIKADENSCRGQVRQTPVPGWRSPSAVVRGHEGFLSRAESPRTVSSDWKPNQVEEEVEQDDPGRGPEDVTEVSS